jgi:signal transduction histidine kinase
MRTQFHIVAVEDGVADAETIARHLADAGLRCVVRQVKTEPDITSALPRHASEDSRAHRELLHRLARGIAHEINTPIQYISNSAHFLASAFNEIVSAIPGAGQPPDGTADLRLLLAEVPRTIERIIEGSQRVAAIVRAMQER